MLVWVINRSSSYYNICNCRIKEGDLIFTLCYSVKDSLLSLLRFGCRRFVQVLRVSTVNYRASYCRYYCRGARIVDCGGVIACRYRRVESLSRRVGIPRGDPFIAAVAAPSGTATSRREYHTRLDKLVEIHAILIALAFASLSILKK